ncbi:MAG: DUF305 domain-containing protein [Chloroflexota bacterium]
MARSWRPSPRALALVLGVTLGVLAAARLARAPGIQDQPPTDRSASGSKRGILGRVGRRLGAVVEWTSTAIPQVIVQNGGPLPRAATRGRAATNTLGLLELLRAPFLAFLTFGGFAALLTRRDPERGFRTGFLNGLLSSTFSTAIIALGSPRLGRSRGVDWMQLTSVWFGTKGIRAKPTIWSELPGVLVHQTADVLWATLWFGAGARWLKRLSASTLLALSVPWAVLTSIIEYYFLLPWLQPLVPRQVPYWTALTVHLTSGAAYPVFPWLHQKISGQENPHANSGPRVLVVLGSAVALLAAVEAFSRLRREPAWPFGFPRTSKADHDFLVNMSIHHVVGVRLAQLAAEKVVGEELRVLARLMVAQQEADNRVMCHWLSSWFGEGLPTLPIEEYEHMAGMPHPSAVKDLEQLDGPAFEERYLYLMIPHHEGALLMSQDALRQARDPRVRFLAGSIIHAQLSQIERMRAQPHAPAETVSPRELFAATKPRDQSAA